MTRPQLRVGEGAPTLPSHPGLTPAWFSSCCPVGGEERCLWNARLQGEIQQRLRGKSEKKSQGLWQKGMHLFTSPSPILGSFLVNTYAGFNIISALSKIVHFSASLVRLSCKTKLQKLLEWDRDRLDNAEERFGSAVPAFHPKFYLTMTKSMADERRQSQLEQYLQISTYFSSTLDSTITNSDVFIILKLQQDTFKSQTQRAFLDVCLSDGSNIRLYTQTSDTAESILQVTLCEVGLLRELIKYFSLFFFQGCDDEALTVVKKVAELELPYVKLQSMKELHCKLGIRKCGCSRSLTNYCVKKPRVV
ncbi:LOW QUALITY PROTEIN: sorting nexin-31 [Acridotheres tristis]